MYPSENPLEDTIRTRREVFNSAIAEKNVELIRSLLAPSYHIVIGRRVSDADRARGGSKGNSSDCAGRCVDVWGVVMM